ncbi:sporulation integral membrane protein YtvI [Paenibacillus sp. DS2015]|uniref:sporulation integral membrane protein YtvI n=1 Tax=Paenibacillus sp. DS2015 TaxID=3373917 RepID=UPI003D261C90
MDKVMTKRILRGIWVCVAAVSLGFAIYWLLPLLYPFVIAWFIAYLIHPLVSFIHRRIKLPRWLAVIISIFITFGGAILILSAAVTRIVKELIGLSQTFDLHTDTWRDFFTSWTDNAHIQGIIEQINNFYTDNPNYQNAINTNISKTTQTVGTAVTDFITGFFNIVLGFISALPSMGTILVIILLATFFLSKNWDQHNARLIGLVPPRVRKPISEIWSDLKKAFHGYIRAQLILISITAVTVMTGLLILRVPSAFTIGLMIGLVDLLPYLGVGIVLVPWAIYTLLSGNMILGIGLSILYLVIMVVRQIMEPKVLASSVGLDPLATLIGMFVGLKLFGVLGLLIGPVIIIIINAFNSANVFRDLRNYIVGGRLR